MCIRDRVTYNMLHGAAPWAHLNGVAAAKAAALDLDRPPVPRHWDARLAAILKDAWAADADARPSFAQVLTRLGELDEGSKAAEAAGCNCVVS